MSYKCKHFGIEELVSPQVSIQYGEKAWEFFDPRALVVLDWIREKTGKPVTVNDWFWGGEFEQRGFRANIDPIVKEKTFIGILYCSPHMRGMAFDLNVEGMTTAELIDWLEEHKEEIPYNIRIEIDDVERLHYDTIDKGTKIYYFKP